MQWKLGELSISPRRRRTFLLSLPYERALVLGQLRTAASSPLPSWVKPVFNSPALASTTEWFQIPLLHVESGIAGLGDFLPPSSTFHRELDSLISSGQTGWYIIPTLTLSLEEDACNLRKDFLGGCLTSQPSPFVSLKKEKENSIQFQTSFQIKTPEVLERCLFAGFPQKSPGIGETEGGDCCAGSSSS